MTVLLINSTDLSAVVYLENRLIGRMEFRGVASPVRFKMEANNNQTRNRTRFNSAWENP